MDTETLQRPSAAPSWAGRALDALDRAVTGALILAVATMVIVVSGQVALRYGFNQSFDWADEVGRLAFVWSVFLAIPLGVRQGSHIGIDIVVDKFPAATRAAFKRGGAALSAALMFIVAWASVGVAQEQWSEMMSTIDASVGWFIVPVGVGALLSGLHLARVVIIGAPAPVLGNAE